MIGLPSDNQFNEFYQQRHWTPILRSLQRSAVLWVVDNLQCLVIHCWLPFNIRLIQNGLAINCSITGWLIRFRSLSEPSSWVPWCIEDVRWTLRANLVCFGIIILRLEKNARTKFYFEGNIPVELPLLVIKSISVSTCSTCATLFPGDESVMFVKFSSFTTHQLQFMEILKYTPNSSVEIYIFSLRILCISPALCILLKCASTCKVAWRNLMSLLN